MNISSEEYRLICSRATLQNKKEGCFSQLVQSLREGIDLFEFSKCTTDLARVSYVALYCWHHIGAELIFKGKNANEAISRRKEGNEAFESKNFQKALLLYSQSIIRAPVGKELQAAYSNRSALFFELKDYESAISDAEMAISYSVDEDTRHVLYERISSSYIHLKNYKKAKVSLKLAEHFMTKNNVTDPKLVKKIQKSKKIITENEVTTTECSPKTPPQESKNEAEKISRSSIFKNASHKFSVEKRGDEGRVACAVESILPGEEILAEDPYAACLILERNGTHCQHCFKKLRAAIACEVCSSVAFCSRKCRQESNVYHQHECRILTLLMGTGMSVLPHLALRIITQKTAKELIEEFDTLQCRPSEVFLDENKSYDTLSYRNIFNLIGLEELRTTEDFLERTIMSVFLTKCLRLVGYFDINQFKNPDPTGVELKIGALILRNLQVLQFNAYEIHEVLLDESSKYEKMRLVNLGLGVYPTASFINHSCVPNVTRYFEGKKLVIDAIRPIRANGVIYDNYGPIFSKMTQKMREQKLDGRYWFKCQCEGCENPGLFCLLQEMAEISSQKNKDFDDAIELMNKLKGEEAIKKLAKFLQESKMIGKNKKLNKSFFLGQEAMKLCTSTKGTHYIMPTCEK